MVLGAGQGTSEVRDGELVCGLARTHLASMAVDGRVSNQSQIQQLLEAEETAAAG